MAYTVDIKVKVYHLALLELNTYPSFQKTEYLGQYAINSKEQGTHKIRFFFGCKEDAILFKLKHH